MSKRLPVRALSLSTRLLLLAVIPLTIGCSGDLLPPTDPTARASDLPTAAAPSTVVPSPVAPVTALPRPSPRRTEAVTDVVPPGVVDPPPGEGIGRYDAQPLTWSACRNGLQCATVLAPLDWADPDGRALTLVMSRRPATGTPSRGLLFVNPGGPGGSGLDLPRSLPLNGLDGFDVVGWDPRGVGESTPVRCLDAAGTGAYLSVDTSPDDAAEEGLLADANRTLGLACRANSGVLLDHVSTESTVRDLDLFRRLLGAATIDFYGASYGTVIGSFYAELFPTHVGRFVLDGAVVLGSDGLALQTQGFAQAFDAFADWCAARSCPLGSSRAQVLGRTVDLLTQLDARPLAVRDRQLSQSLAVAAIVQTLYGNADTYPLLSRILAAGVRGDGAPLLAVADVATQRSPDGSYGQINAAFPAIRCLDEGDAGVSGAVAEGRRLATEVTGIGPFLGPDLTCPEWPVAAQPYRVPLTAPQAPPILVVGTTGDPATPYRSAVQLAAQLRSGRLLTLVGVGHTAYRQSACVQQQVVAFYLDGTLPPVGAAC